MIQRHSILSGAKRKPRSRSTAKTSWSPTFLSLSTSQEEEESRAKRSRKGGRNVVLRVRFKRVSRSSWPTRGYWANQSANTPRVFNGGKSNTCEDNPCVKLRVLSSPTAGVWRGSSPSATCPVIGYHQGRPVEPRTTLRSLNGPTSG